MERNEAEAVGHESGINTNKVSNEVPLTSNAEGWQTVKKKKAEKEKNGPAAGSTNQ
jgi:hypothetical protein